MLESSKHSRMQISFIVAGQTDHRASSQHHVIEFTKFQIEVMDTFPAVISAAHAVSVHPHLSTPVCDYSLQDDRLD